MHDNFIRSLPLVASALGRKYGLKVVIGGDQAATNGDTIYLPSLPLISPPELTALARGFLDHEAAHVRETNMKTLRSANLNPLEMHVWNTIEDWRVEKILGDIFPGCRRNFDWLIRHMFDRDQEEDVPLDLEILNWLLLEIRSWAVPELKARVYSLEQRIETELAGLIPVLKLILDRINQNCPDTKSAVAYAREIVEALRQWQQEVLEGKHTHAVISSCDDADVSAGHLSSGVKTVGEKIIVIQTLLDRPAVDLPKGIGEAVGRILSMAKTEENGGLLQVAQVCHRVMCDLTANRLAEAKMVTTILKYKLQSLLQAMTLQKVKAGYRGRLDTKTIHKLFVADPKIFRRPGTRIGHSTAVHLLIDASGSMSGSINLVSLLSYSLCRSLSEMPGISVGASVFPGQQTRRTKGRDKCWETISPLLRHGQAMHTKFQLEAEGGTPMGEAIWWALQEMAPLKESRKIIMILTDGEPDYWDNTKAAISEAKHQGYEMYGLGIGCTSIKSLLPGNSTEITHQSELPRKLFELLGQAIIRTA